MSIHERKIRQDALQLYLIWQSKQDQTLKQECIDAIKETYVSRERWDMVVAMAESSISLESLEEIIVRACSNPGTLHKEVFEATYKVLEGFVENQPVALRMLAELYWSLDNMDRDLRPILRGPDAPHFPQPGHVPPPERRGTPAAAAGDGVDRVGVIRAVILERDSPVRLVQHSAAHRDRVVARDRSAMAAPQV
jgi:hypothetical protein